jgi:4,5-DOPA dioxygenase extradiol
MNSNVLNKLPDMKNDSSKMPVLFVGHGSPMNAIEDNEFSNEWKKVGNSIPKPEYILCVSAHWETPGSYVTAMENPPTIHDFGGFPKELYEVEYPAPGSPELARRTVNNIKKTEVKPDKKWGLDHGTWSILKHMYPDADVPVIQLSLDYGKTPQYHYELAKELAFLRKKGVLIIGSGNMVHNLRIIDWRNANGGHDWAVEANSKFKNLILNNEHMQLIEYNKLGKEIELAVPTPEHFLPLLYALALKEENENVTFFNDKTVLGSLSMTSVIIN